MTDSNLILRCGLTSPDPSLPSDTNSAHFSLLIHVIKWLIYLTI